MIFALVVSAISILMAILTVNPFFLFGLVIAFVYQKDETKTKELKVESGYQTPGCLAAIGAGSLVGLLILLVVLAGIAMVGEASMKRGIDGQTQQLREFRCGLPTVAPVHGALEPLRDFANEGC